MSKHVTPLWVNYDMDRMGPTMLLHWKVSKETPTHAQDNAVDKIKMDDEKY